MRKILAYVTFIFIICYSCKKDPIAKPNTIFQTFSVSTVSGTGITTEPLGVNLAKLMLLDLCSNEIWTCIGGTAVFYITSDGKIKPLGVYNFVFQDKKGNMYSGRYNIGVEPFILFSADSNTYKLTFNPQGVTNDRTILALMRISVDNNDMYTVSLDSGTILCR